MNEWEQLENKTDKKKMQSKRHSQPSYTVIYKADTSLRNSTFFSVDML